jgi:hypothetical protein
MAPCHFRGTSFIDTECTCHSGSSAPEKCTPHHLNKNSQDKRTTFSKPATNRRDVMLASRAVALWKDVRGKYGTRLTCKRGSYANWWSALRPWHSDASFGSENMGWAIIASAVEHARWPCIVLNKLILWGRPDTIAPAAWKMPDKSTFVPLRSSVPVKYDERMLNTWSNTLLSQHSFQAQSSDVIYGVLDPLSALSSFRACSTRASSSSTKLWKGPIPRRIFLTQLWPFLATQGPLAPAVHFRRIPACRQCTHIMSFF